MKLALFLLLGLSACTTVNTNGSIKRIKYNIIKNNEVTVETDASNCPILEIEANIENNKSKIISKCKTILK